MELVRTLLLAVEADPSFDGTPHLANADSLGVTDHSNAEMAYHLGMLVEAGFLVGNTKKATNGLVLISKVTWEGHELADDIRDPEIWRKTKERAKTVAGIGLNFLWEIAKAELKTKLGLP